MKKILLILPLILVACSNDDKPTPDEPFVPEPELVGENLIICCEGNWQSDNGQLSYYDAQTGKMTNQWFRQVNGTKLGDTPNDIVQVNENLIAIAVNWSNIIQYIRPDGTACGATENVPNNRRLCSDGNYLYVTSYAHRCGTETFDKGYVAKIDVQTRQVVATCPVGWEPEGIKLYKGRLYVANSGGYAFSEDHHYETTISIVDAATMQPVKTIDTGCINLGGPMSQAGQFLCVNSGSDYYTTNPATVIVDCETDETYTLAFPSTCNTTDGRLFYTVGASFSYLTGEYKYYINTIDPATKQVTEGIYNAEVTEVLKSLQSPYGLYVSPYTGNLYFTDGRGFATSGYVYGYAKDGTQLFEPQKVYVNPAHMLAVPIGG